jgi:hypothetical protein
LPYETIRSFELREVGLGNPSSMGRRVLLVSDKGTPSTSTSREAEASTKADSLHQASPLG